MRGIEKEKEITKERTQSENENPTEFGNSNSTARKLRTDDLKKVEETIKDSEKGKSVITLAGNLAIGGGNFIVINATDAKDELEKILEGISKISPDAVDKIMNALADKISNEK